MHQADGAFLDQILKRNRPIAIGLGDVDDEAHIRLDQPLARDRAALGDVLQEGGGDLLGATELPEVGVFEQAQQLVVSTLDDHLCGLDETRETPLLAGREERCLSQATQIARNPVFVVHQSVRRVKLHPDRTDFPIESAPEQLNGASIMPFPRCLAAITLTSS